MKKYFLLSVAAVGLMFGCQKKELSNGNESVSNDGPVLVKMNIDVPSAVIPATKGHGSVDAWKEQELTLLAYKGEDWTKPENSLFTAPIKTKAPASGYGPDLVDVKQTVDGVSDVPVYYKDNDAYDFFGYYLDDLTGTLNVAENGASIDLTIDGTQDIMAAKTDVAQDIAKAGMTGKIKETDVYSAFSARRNVVPGLRFEHVLARFNFYVVAASQSAVDLVQVDEITIDTPVEGTLQVAGKRGVFTPAFTKKGAGNPTSLVLKKAGTEGEMTETATGVPYNGFISDIEAFKNAPAQVLDEAHATAKIGSCVMVMPGEASHTVTVKTSNTRYDKLKINDLVLEVKAAEIITPDGKAITTFAAGYQYDVILMIYGPEEVKVSAYLNEWVDGGYYAHDPEEDKLVEPTEPKVALEAATAATLTFAVESPNDIKAVWAALKDLKTGELTTYEPVTPTKSWKSTVTFEGLTQGQEYECYLSYYEGETLKEDVATGVKAVPSDVTARGAIYVSDLDSYIAIPADYRAGNSYDDRAKYIALWYDEVDGADVTVKYNGEDTKVKEVTVTSATTLMTFAAADLFDGAKELKYGKYEITMSKNTSTSSQTVIIKDPKFEFNKLSVVKDEATYNSVLPVMYRKNNPYSDTLAATMPWIVAEITDCDTPLVTATLEGAQPKTVTYGYDANYDILIIKKDALGTTVTGNWTIDINNEVKTITLE